MLKVYLADDEEVVRQGLKKLIDWETIGYEICGEAGNGLTAYNEIKALNPDLILVDIRMPKLQGLDLASQLRETGFKGHIIVLSGYSEFKYAQEAIRCDVDYYLTKPIDENELTDAINDIKKRIIIQQESADSLSYYQQKARDKILEEIVTREIENISDLQYSIGVVNLKSDQYQVLILTAMNQEIDPFEELCHALKLPHKSNQVERLHHGDFQIVLLKGELIIRRFYSFKTQSDRMDKAYLIAVGAVVETIQQINDSYKEALSVYERQFFLDYHKRIADLTDIKKSLQSDTDVFTIRSSKELGKQLYDLIIVFKKSECERFIDELSEKIIYSNNHSDTIKSVLAGMYIYVVQEFKRSYSSYQPEFMTNAEIIQFFHNCVYLQEIGDFLKIEIRRLIQIIGGFSSDSILDEIVEYIKYHYNEDIKLKSLAPKFGYNSSYLGKIFTKKMGISFNDYLHKIRIDRSKDLLLNSKYKIYEISSLLGYKNVDYFHLRFKQFEQTTPNEYRFAHHVHIEEDKV